MSQLTFKKCELSIVKEALIYAIRDQEHLLDCYADPYNEGRYIDQELARKVKITIKGFRELFTKIQNRLKQEEPPTK